MHIVKELVSVLSSPLVVALLLGAAAAILRLKNLAGGSRWLGISAIVVAYVGSTPLVGDTLLRPLETQFPPLAKDQALPSVAYVVVLGSGFDPRDGIPVSAALDEVGLVRVVEGIRLARRIEGARLVLSGGSRRRAQSPAIGYAELARQLGVDIDALVILDRAFDTRSEANTVAALVGAAPFLLVTSASHMPRAVLLMRRAGLRPIPAPTGQFVNGSASRDWRRWLPSSVGLRMTESALHEYIGLAAIVLGVG